MGMHAKKLLKLQMGEEQKRKEAQQQELVRLKEEFLKEKRLLEKKATEEQKKEEKPKEEPAKLVLEDNPAEVVSVVKPLKKRGRPSTKEE